MNRRKFLGVVTGAATAVATGVVRAKDLACRPFSLAGNAAMSDHAADGARYSSYYLRGNQGAQVLGGHNNFAHRSPGNKLLPVDQVIKEAERMWEQCVVAAAEGIEPSSDQGDEFELPPRIGV